MNRLGRRLLYVLVLLSIVGTFLSPEKSFAQSVNVGNLSNTTARLFTEPKLTLEREVTDQRKLDAGKNSKEFQEFLKINAEEIKAVANAKNAFEDILLDKDKDKPIAQAYSNALDAAINSLNSDLKSNSLLQTSNATSFIQAFINQLTIEKSSQERIAEVATGKVLSTEAQGLIKATAQAANPTTGGRLNNTEKCTSLWDAGIVDCLDAGFSWLIRHTLLEIAGFALWISANMFNYAIQISILSFKNWAPDALYPVWMTVRQLVSLVTVFIGLYLGFMYIIGKDEIFEKYIPWVVIFALFVNFSYPITRTLIDVSNIVSLNVYTAAVGNETLGAGVSSPNTAGALIMNRLGLQGLVFSATNEKQTNVAGVANGLTSTSSTAGALLAVAFIIYASYIFFKMTAIIVARTVILVFFIIVSPILFVDSVMPALGNLAKKWRGMFFDQLFLGPIFMIMLALTLKFLEVFSLAAKAGAATVGNTTIVESFNIIMMLVMLHFMMKVATSFAGGVGETATELLGKVGGFALGAASGGTGLLARATMGRAAAAVRDSNWVKNNQDNFVGRRAYDMSNSVAKSSMDLRNSTVIAGGAKKLGLMGMGMGAKVGYEEEKENKDKENRMRVGLQKNRFKKTIAAYGSEEDDTRQQFFNQQSKEAQDKLRDVDLEAAKREDKERSREKVNEAKFVSNYQKLDGGDKQRMYSAVDSSTKEQLRNADIESAQIENNKRNNQAQSSAGQTTNTVPPTTQQQTSTQANQAERAPVITQVSAQPITQATTNNNQPAANDAEKPGFLKTAEDKIRERDIRIKQERTSGEMTLQPTTTQSSSPKTSPEPSSSGNKVAQVADVFA